MVTLIYFDNLILSLGGSAEVRQTVERIRIAECRL